MPFEFVTFLKSLTFGGYLLVGAAFFVWLTRFLYDIIFYGRLVFRKPAPAGTSSVPLTIMMTERNDEERLKSYLPDWLILGYPNYEILVVDDFSEDNSLATLALLRTRYPRLRFTSLNQETRYSDKLARNLGLKAASHEMVVISHPAALPPDNHWMPGISSAVSGGKEIVLGYCNLVPGKGFTHNLYRAESFLQQADSMACSVSGIPYVTAEENVTFKKSAYFETGGLAGKIREEYLNLEMVVNSIIRPGNVGVLPLGNQSLRKDLQADSIMLRDLYNKSFRLKKHLKPGVRFFLGISRLTSLLLIPLLLTMLIVYPDSWMFAAGLIILKSVFYLLIINRLQKRLYEPELFVTSLLYAIIAPYYRSVMQWRFNQSRRKRKWGN
jgi:glycosyltransferase involved in cell wall biosynthesis